MPFRSARSGAWHDPSTWDRVRVPGDGDRVEVLPDHRVTIARGHPVRIGAKAGRFAGSAIRLCSGGATLRVEADLILNGDLVCELGTSLLVQAPPSGGLTVLFDATPGATSRIRQERTGTGQTRWEFLGTAASRVAFRTSARAVAAGGRGTIQGHAPAVRCRASYVDLIDLGPAGLYDVELASDGPANTILLENVRSRSGNGIRVDGLTGDAVVDVSALDIRASRNRFCLVGRSEPVDNDGGVRRFRRVTIVGSSDSDHGRHHTIDLRGRDWSVEESVLVDATVEENETPRRNAVRHTLFIAEKPSTSFYAVIALPESGCLVEHCGFILASSNPHAINAEGPHAGYAPLTFQHNVCDGMDFLPDGATGELHFGAGSAFLHRNISINRFGSLGLNRDATTRIRIIGNTCYRSGPIVLGHVTGGAANFLEVHANLFVDQPYGARQQPDSPDFVRQDLLDWDYNCYFGLTGPDRIDGGPFMVPTQVHVNVPRLSLGTDSTTIVAADAVFLGSGVIAGDYVVHRSKGFARIEAVESDGVLRLAAPGIADLAHGDEVTVARGYWSTAGARYGDEGRGRHDLSVDPEFRDPTRGAESWDRSNGGDGSIAHIREEAVKLNGYGHAGEAAPFDLRYRAESFLSYVREGFTPQSTRLLRAGHPDDGARDIGAVDIANAHHAAVTPDTRRSSAPLR